MPCWFRGPPWRREPCGDFFQLHDAAPSRAPLEDLAATHDAQANHSPPKPAARGGGCGPALTPRDLKTLVADMRDDGFPASFVRCPRQAPVSKPSSPRIKEIAGQRERDAVLESEKIGWKSQPEFYEEMSQLYPRNRSRVMRDVLGDEFLASTVERSDRRATTPVWRSPQVPKIESHPGINDDLPG